MLDPSLSQVWNRHLQATRASVEALESAAAQPDSQRLREEASQQAHRLAGTLGSFGFSSAGDLCRTIMEKLEAGDSVSTAPLVARLRADLPLDPSPDPSAPAGLAPEPPSKRSPDYSVLVIDRDPAWVEELREAAGTRLMGIENASDPSEVLDLMRTDRFDLVILTFEAESEATSGLLRLLSDGWPSLPVIVVGESGDLVDRLNVARLGGRGFLQKPLTASAVLDEAEAQIERLAQQRHHVLVLDDDPKIGEILATCLDSQDIDLTATTTAQEMWEVLERRSVDLLVLDLQLIEVSGLEVLRILRNEQRFLNLPVLILTAQNDRSTLEQVFAAGADDFIGKPIFPVEVRARVRNRLERSQLLRELSERDQLTGLTNRRRAVHLISQYMQLARRQKQPLSIGLLDVDHFKRLNDTKGHAIGDLVLRSLGKELRTSFRSEDVLVRWGGEEFLLVMYGVGLADAVFRLAEFLELVRANVHYPEQEHPVTFSGGVAQMGAHGDTLEKLYQAADEALYQAKNAGRDRVLGAGGLPKLWLEDSSAQLRRSVISRGFEVVDSADSAELRLAVGESPEEALKTLRKRDPRREIAPNPGD